MTTVFYVWTGEKNPKTKTWKKPLQPLAIRLKKAEANLIRRLKR